MIFSSVYNLFFMGQISAEYRWGNTHPFLIFLVGIRELKVHHENNNPLALSNILVIDYKIQEKIFYMDTSK